MEWSILRLAGCTRYDNISTRGLRSLGHQAMASCKSCMACLEHPMSRHYNPFSSCICGLAHNQFRYLCPAVALSKQKGCGVAEISDGPAHQLAKQPVLLATTSAKKETRGRTSCGARPVTA